MTSTGARSTERKEACSGHFGETAAKAHQASGREALTRQRRTWD
ncbi:hypothetical protein V6Z12_D06G225900 [Gossypium hirsutum]